jgi:amino acid adenylation domain-containing protein
MRPTGYHSTLLHSLFEETVPHFKDERAVVFHEQHLTYSELDRRADRLAQSLLRQAESQEIIGLSTTRSLEMLVGLLAILKAGKAYLPLDPNFPLSRLEQVVTGSGIKWCVATSSESAVFQDLKLEVIPSEIEHPEEQATVEQQNENACVLYTSGSTGKPKGVCVPHKGLVNFLLWQKDHSKAAPFLRTSQFCHLGFDVSIEEIFVPLITGGTLYLMDDNIRLDSGNLLHFIQNNDIHRMYLPYVELQYFAEEAIKENFFPSSLIEVITGGELLKITPQISTLFNSLNNCPLKNKYGPTEACIWVTALELNGDASKWPEIPTIGKPFANTTIYILNDQLELLPDGEEGEICIQGICVANGYLNEPELTAKSFINWTDPQGNILRLYKTGDLGKILPDGNIEFHGRRDGQVKIRGNRIELADIEVALMQQADVQQAVVIAREDVPGKKYLAAYLVNREGEVDIKQLRNSLINALPDYMIPSYFVQLEELPKTSSGKVDRKLLPKPEAKRPDFGVLYKSPSTEVEKNITQVLVSLFQFDKIGVDDNFFEMGGNSLLAQKAISELKHQFKYTLPITKLYQFPTIAGMAAYITNSQFPARDQQRAAFKKQGAKSSTEDHEIAVIAMSGRFPGADNIEELWEMLKEGKEAITFFEEKDLDPAVDVSLKNDPMYVKARGIVKDADQFDPEFFGINPKLAELMDPQQRIFMEICWEALETAGYLPQNGHYNIGVFAGSYNNTYYLNNVQHNKQLVDQVGEFQVMSANEKDYIASRAAYHLNLKGPAVSVYSACSTSLLAIVQAVESLRKGQCELALAGGASINSPVNSGHLYQEGAMLSADGHCRPFDADSTGTLFSDGAGVVLLKSLQKAKEDGDNIYAVIKGVGVNNDGGEKGSFTAPSAVGQAGAIQMALDDGQVDPSTISYVEAHGTGTPLGDPIEMEGLGIAFGPQSKKQYCAIGSIKSNIGHLTAAAGVAGFIKTVLAMQKQQIPPSLGFRNPNPHIDFANSPFYVNNKLAPWNAENKRLAGISSFGVGGTNVHVVVEDYQEQRLSSEASRKPQLITWSARSEKSRANYASRLLNWAKNRPTCSLEELAYTLQNTRAGFNRRSFVVASSFEGLCDELIDRNGIRSHDLVQIPSEVVFCFPGQGAQYINMGKELYEDEPIYRSAVDHCAEILNSIIGTDIRQVIMPAAQSQEAEEKLKDTRYTQPALFVTEYALAQLWMSWGIQPSVLCGHSLGEYVAAHLSGVFSLEDALKVVAARGRLISNLPKGNMLSVRATVDTVRRLLLPELSLAAINSKEHCVVSGEDRHIKSFAQVLDSKEIPHQLLNTSHAFHSAMMEPIISSFREVLDTVHLNKPQRPIISTVTGTWLKDEQATDVLYWTEHIKHTVRFADALATINSLGTCLFLEVGPGKATSTLARRELDPKNHGIVTSLEQVSGRSEIEAMLMALGKVWLHGIEPNWKAFYGGRKLKPIILPNYAFDKKRCWVDAPSFHSAPPKLASETATNFSKNAAFSVSDSRAGRLQKAIARVLKISGIESYDLSQSFLEIGLDSLLLTQVALNLKKEFDLPITFRKLSEEYFSPSLLIQYLEKNLPHNFFEEEEVLVPINADSPVVDSGNLIKAVESINHQIQQLSLQLMQIKTVLSEGKMLSDNLSSSNYSSPGSIRAGDHLAEAYNEERRPTSNVGWMEDESGVFEQQITNIHEPDYYLYPPVREARLGKDAQGNPGWYVKNPDEDGGYLQVLLQD